MRDSAFVVIHNTTIKTTRRPAGRTTNRCFHVRFVVSAVLLLLLALTRNSGRTIAATTMLSKKYHHQVVTTTMTMTTKMMTMMMATILMRSHNVLPLRHTFVSCSALSSIPLNSRRYTTSNDNSYIYESTPISARFGINRYRGGWSEHQSRKQQLQQSRYNSSNNREDYDTDNDDDNKNKKTKSSLVSRIASTSSSIVLSSPNKISKVIRQGTGTIFSLAGFLGSSVISFATDRRSFQDRFIEPIEALNKFLRTSGYVLCVLLFISNFRSALFVSFDRFNFLVFIYLVYEKIKLTSL
jgi:hypothetical protein